MAGLPHQNRPPARGTAPQPVRRLRTRGPRPYRRTSPPSTYALYAATNARRATAPPAATPPPRRDLRRAHRAAVPVLVRHRDQQPHPLRHLQHPHRPRGIPWAPAPRAHAPPAPGTRPPPPPPPARNRPRPAATAPPSHPATPPPAPLRLAQRRHIRGRRLPHRQHPPDHLDVQIPLRPGLAHLRHQPVRHPVRDHGLLRLQRPRVEVRRTAQPQRMPRHRQRHPETGRPQPPQPAERQREPTGPASPWQPLDAVHRVLSDNREGRLVRRDESRQKRVSQAANNPERGSTSMPTA